MDELTFIERHLLHPDAEERLRAFREEERLRDLLPEIYRLEGVPQPPDHHPEGDVLAHTLLAVRHLPPGVDRRLAWAALLHDVGKAATTQEVAGRIRAFGHDREGAQTADEVLRRLGMGEEERQDVIWLIRHHMFALSWRVDRAQDLSRRQKRFMADPRFPLLLSLMEIDARAACGNPGKLGQVEFYRRAHASIEREKNC